MPSISGYRCARASIAVWILVILAGQPALCQDAAKNCKENCAFRRDRVHVDIDANTGQVTGGTQFAAGTNVQIVLTHKNPFKYKYRVEMTSAALEEAIALGFFAKFVPGLSLLGALPAAATPEAGPAAPAAPACTADDNKKWDALVGAATPVTAVGNKVAAALDPRVATYKTYETFVTTTDTDTLPTPCDKLCETAASLSGSLSTLIDLGQLPADVKAFADAAAKLAVPIADFKTASDSCKDSHATALAAYEALAAKAAEVKKQVDQLADAKKTFQDLQKLLRDVLADEYPFNEPFYPQLVGQSTGVTVNIFRTNLRQAEPKEKRVATIFIRIGESAVSVSMGLGVTSAVERRIGRVPATVTGADGKDTLGNRFGYLENDGSRAVALAMLNARLPVAGVGWMRAVPSVVSTGVGLRLGSGGVSQADWIPIAGGWRSGSDHALLTLGWHLTATDCLPDPNDSNLPCKDRVGFKIGDVVPATLSDPLTFQRVFTKGLTIGVTFKTQ